MTAEPSLDGEPCPTGTNDGLVTTPIAHTMGKRLADYVLPKVNLNGLLTSRGRCRVYSNESLGLLTGCEKRLGKRFNWRRPCFVTRHGLTHCVTAPGRDYTYHYTRLISTACHLLGIDPVVEVELPHPGASDDFVDRWLPKSIPMCDVVVLGYVERLFPNESTSWTEYPGFGWRSTVVGKLQVILLGCEFSYWGDLAGAVVTVLAARRVSPWVIYAGKLGALAPELEPNQYVATGCTSNVGGHSVRWRPELNVDDIGPHGQVLTDQRHVTVPSTLDETKAWYQQQIGLYDLVDPEIGKMADAAGRAGVQFDYLHIVSDNLSGRYHEGLYDERHAGITANRTQCLTLIESILRRSFE